MKKILTLLLFAATIAGCKKEDYTAGEFYTVTYQTKRNTMNISLSATQDINPANYNIGNANYDKPVKKIRYIIELQEKDYYKMEFIKLDGTVVPLELSISDKEMNLHF